MEILNNNNSFNRINSGKTHLYIKRLKKIVSPTLIFKILSINIFKE
jgi:hypothetical protein